MFFYRYDQFGDETVGYRHYDQPRPFVKASRTTFVSRDLYQFFASAGYGEVISTSKHFMGGVSSGSPYKSFLPTHADIMLGVPVKQLLRSTMRRRQLQLRWVQLQRDDDNSFQMDEDQPTVHKRANLVCYSDTESSLLPSTSADSTAPTSGTIPPFTSTKGSTSESRK